MPLSFVICMAVPSLSFARVLLTHHYLFQSKPVADEGTQMLKV
jgi:hypothetical protein